MDVRPTLSMPDRDVSTGLAASATGKPAAPQMALRDYALICLQSLLWGSAFFFVALVGTAVEPITITMLRLAPACLVLLLVVQLLGLRLPATREFWGKMLVMAAFNNVLPFVLIIYAQRDVTGGTAAIFNATAPLFAVLIAPLFVPEERWSWVRLLGIACGIGGVAILVGGAGAAVGPKSAALLLTAACCYASANVMTRRFFPGVPPFVIACSQMLAALVLAVIAAFVLERPLAMAVPSMTVVLAILGMGVFGSALASLCHFTVLRRAGPTNAMLVTIILPVTPILLGGLLLGEEISVRQVVGGFVIALALLIIDGRWLRRRRPVAEAEQAL